MTGHFHGYRYFNPLTLTLGFGLLSENCNIIKNLSTVNARALIFHMSFPWDKLFLLVLSLFTLTFELFSSPELKLKLKSAFLIACRCLPVCYSICWRHYRCMCVHCLKPELYFASTSPNRVEKE